MASSQENDGVRWIVAGGAGVLVLLLLCGGGYLLLGRVMATLFGPLPPEFDGKRPLIAGYELNMLKAYPRSILEADGFDQIMVPSETGLDATMQVNRYAIVEQWIVGRIDPWSNRTGHRPQLSDPETPKSEYFVIDTGKHSLTYYKSRSEWCAACKGLGFACDDVVWVDPNPKANPPDQP